MSEVFLLSDVHAFHENIIRYCNRPFADADEMNAEIEKRWNLIVSPDDVMIFVGDLSAGLGGRREDLKAFIGRLLGRKVLVKGNHDHQSDEFYLEAGFERVVDYVSVPGLLFVHVPDTKVDETSRAHPWADITKKLREEFQPKLVIHGHDHRVSIPEFPGHFNCAADRHAYMPFSLQSTLERCGLGDMVKQAREDIFSWLQESKNA